MIAKAEWIEGIKFKVSDARGHEIISDVPEKYKGTDQGSTGLEMMIMGLASCLSAVFVIIANNSGIQYSQLLVEIETEKPKGEKTITSTKAKINVKSDAPKEKLERILKKVMNSCPVGLIFEKAGINIETELIVEGL